MLFFTARLGGIVISKTQAALDKFGVSQASADARDAGGINIGEGLTSPAVLRCCLQPRLLRPRTNVRLQELSLFTACLRTSFGNTFKNVALSVYAALNLWMIYNKALTILNSRVYWYVWSGLCLLHAPQPAHYRCQHQVVSKSSTYLIR